jgi:hypothetical protein
VTQVSISAMLPRLPSSQDAILPWTKDITNAISTAVSSIGRELATHDHIGGRGASINLTSAVTGVLPVPSGGTGASTLASGRLLIGADTGAVVTDDLLRWDTTNKALGIGRAPAGGRLHVYEPNSVDLTVRLEALAEKSANLRFYEGGAQVGRFLAATGNTAGNKYFGFLSYSSSSGERLPIRFFTTDAGGALKDHLYLAAGTNQGRVGIGTTSPSSLLDVVGDVEIGSSNYYYIGDPSTDGSWRIAISGADLVFQRRISGVWTTKGTFTG